MHTVVAVEVAAEARQAAPAAQAVAAPAATGHPAAQCLPLRAQSIKAEVAAAGGTTAHRSQQELPAGPVL